MTSHATLTSGDGHRRGRGGAAPLVLAALAVLVAGVLLGRATAGPDDRPQARAPGAAAGATTPAAAGPGPSRVEAGVPVGYARTEAGAVAAAAQYLAAFDGDRSILASEQAAVLEVIAADGARAELAARMRPGVDVVVERFGIDAEVARDPGFVARSVLAGHQLTGYDGDEATVRVWATSILFAEDRHAATGRWSTETVRLRWERGDWRLVGFSSEEGPTPPSIPTPAVPRIGEQINAFERFVHVPAP